MSIILEVDGLLGKMTGTVYEGQVTDTSRTAKPTRARPLASPKNWISIHKYYAFYSYENRLNMGYRPIF